MISYLNWAGIGPLTRHAYIRSLFAPELAGNVLEMRWIRRVERLREKVAAWLGCAPRNVGFTPSTTAAIIVAANGAPLDPGDTVVYGLDDFPANVMPWERLARRGVQPHGVSDWNLPWPASTKMVTVSTVDFSTGIELPWRDVVRRAGHAGLWTCVDAIQSAGIRPSFDPLVDFWCAGTQKWLASGLGLAIFVVSDRVLGRLDPPFPTWLALNDPPLLASGLSPTARAWELGWITPQPLARLDANLSLFEGRGWDTIADETKRRRDYLHDRLADMGWTVVSDATRWSGIVSIAPGAALVPQIVQDGYRKRIVTAHRGDYVRLSPHAFTPMRDVRRAVDWLSKWRTRVARNLM